MRSRVDPSLIVHTLASNGSLNAHDEVVAAFGTDIDFAILNKLYGAEPGNETRYSPAVGIGCKRETVTGDPDPRFISTVYVECQNLTMHEHAPVHQTDERLQPRRS